MATLLHLPCTADLLAHLAQDARLKCPETLVLLPNHRAIERLTSLLKRQGGFLPQMMPLGELHTIWLYQQALQGSDAQALLTIPPAADSAYVQLALARELMAAAPEAPMTFDMALQMAASIWQSFEALEREGRQVAELLRLSHADVSEHWRERLFWLRYAAQWWIAFSDKEGVVTATQRRNLQAEWLVQHWQKHRPEATVILAGSTGSQYSTLQLMQAVLRLEKGEVWVQGYDADSVDMLSHQTHPQAVLQRLMAQLTPERSIYGAVDARSAALYAAFRAQAPVPCPQGITPICARDEEEEALLAAFLACEALQQPQQLQQPQNVAIIVNQPDQMRRIEAALARFGIQADNAQGSSVLQLSGIRQCFLLMEAVLSPSDAAGWLAYLKSVLPRSCVEAFEIKALRTRRSGGAALILDRIRAYLQHEDVSAAAIEAFDDCLSQMAPLLKSLEQRLQPPLRLFEAHLAALPALCAASRAVLEPCRSIFAALPACALEDYAAMLRYLLLQQKVFSARQKAAHVQLYSPIEARFMRASRVILCGLNEGQWPAQIAPSGWLHPVLAARLGVSDAALGISLSAHDFLTASGMGDDVFWLRAARSDGTDQLPSRWLERFERKQEHTSPYLAWVRALRQAPKAAAPQPPAPAAPYSLWPECLSVTALELLLRNPYGFYAKHLLRLQKLQPLERQADASLRGDLVHRVLERFTKALNAGAPLSEQTYQEVLTFELHKEQDLRVQMQWAARLEAMAECVVALEKARRQEGVRIKPEEQVEMSLQGITIFGRIDRLEQQPEGDVVIDYKTGSLPPTKELLSGHAPQLPMLGAMLGGRCIALAYLQVGSVAEPLKEVPVKADIAALIAWYCAGIERLLAYYQRPDAVYAASPQPEAAPRYHDYAHLAREALWMRDGGAF